MQFLELVPRIQASPRDVARLLAAQPLPADLTGEDVVVFCNELLLAADEFAYELIRVVICKRHARSIVLIGAGQRFLGQMEREAERLFVRDQVTTGLWRTLRSTVPREVALKYG